MMRENIKLYLCDWRLEELLINLGKIKGEKKGIFWYGNLLVFLMLYFLNHTPGTGRKQWDFDIPVGR